MIKRYWSIAVVVVLVCTCVIALLLRARAINNSPAHMKSVIQKDVLMKERACLKAKNIEISKIRETDEHVYFEFKCIDSLGNSASGEYVCYKNKIPTVCIKLNYFR